MSSVDYLFNQESSEEMIDFVNFPETNLAAATSTRAIAIDSGVVFEPLMASYENPMPWEHMFVQGKAQELTQQSNHQQSPCASKPLRLPCQTHCHVQQPCFELLRQDIASSLRAMTDFDFHYDASSQMWKGKAIAGVHCLEVTIRCYWDKKQQDHILAVNKIAGDMCHMSANTIFQRLQAHLLPATASTSSSSAAKKCPSMTLKSVPMCSRAKLVLPTSVSFLSALQQVNTMLEEAVVAGREDVRCESAKMFYDIINQYCSTASEEEMAAEIRVLLTRNFELLFSHNKTNSLDDASMSTTTEQCAVLSLLNLLTSNVFSRKCAFLLPANREQDFCVLSALMTIIFKSFSVEDNGAKENGEGLSTSDVHLCYFHAAVQRNAVSAMVHLLTEYVATQPMVVTILRSSVKQTLQCQEQYNAEDTRLRDMISQQLLPLLVTV